MGAWGRALAAPGGPWGASQGGDPMSETQTLPSPLGFRIEIYDDFDVDLGSFWGRSWVPLGGHFRPSWRFFSPEVGPGTVFEPSHLRKSDFARNNTFSNTFW